MIKKKENRPSLFYSLADMLDQSHPLYLLADKIDWKRFDEAFTPLYSEDMGAPAKDIRPLHLLRSRCRPTLPKHLPIGPH